MSYQFHAWARKSIAAQITTADNLGQGTPPSDVRVKIPIQLEVSGQTQPITKQFTIAGPGDIIGISKDMIIRTDPRPNSGDFEPNYFASIEFYDEDFPWRYTPAAPVGPKNSCLRPWLMLIVLTENEFSKTKRARPLSSIIVTETSALPPADEIHLWAHVHTNLGDDAETDLEKIIESLRVKSKTDPDGIISRIICPRKLEADVLYHAFLIPVFESGRLAGLDLPSNETPAQQAAWTAESEQIELPVYYRWQFRTGANADFETLLRMMEPRKELDPKVGVRDLVCVHPGYIKVAGDGEIPAPSPDTLSMGGAVKQISTQLTDLDKSNEQLFIKEIKAHFDLVIQEKDLEHDPVVTIPFYGNQYAKTFEGMPPEFNPSLERWPQQINLDPRNRVAAGLGTQVVQNKQEKLMQRAWLQLPKINEINRKIKQMQLALEVNERMLQSTVMKMGNNSGQIVAIAMPAASRMKETNLSKTIFQTLTESQVPNATLSSAFRRLSRPNGSISRKLKRAADFSLGRMFNRVNPQSAQTITSPVRDWLTITSAIRINDNLPGLISNTVFTQIPSLKSNIKSRQTIGRDIAIDKKIFNQSQEISSIILSQPRSTVRIPEDFFARVLNVLKPVKTLLPGFRASISGLPKPPQTQEEVLPVMAYPDFPEPTYQYLADINQDFIVPNLQLVPPNTIALLEPNFEFIHSFLVGINHEMARELLWREYPTDQRGTYFRQFWDAGGLRSPEGSDPINNYKDIKPITDWKNITDISDFSAIGRSSPHKPLVLLLKGDLLKKYPNTIVFAQKARRRGQSKPELDERGANDNSNFKLPMFSGNLAPDVRLLGFDLTIADAKGIDRNDAGWFFVLAEVPGEPRFGLDINYTRPERESDPNTWDNVSLENFEHQNHFVLIAEKPQPHPVNGKGWPNDSNETKDEKTEKWGRCSADMAGILFQKSSMMAIHGKELLKEF